MDIEVVKLRTYGDARDALAGICTEFAAAVRDDPALERVRHLAPVRLVLGGAEECRHWSVTEKAVGFHAVGALIPSEDGDDEYELNEALEAHVNLDAALALLAEGWKNWDDAERASEVEAWLVTVPHELLHVREWMTKSRGRTPLQVFDEDDGEMGLRRVAEAVSAGFAEAGLDEEEATEALAVQITWRCFAGRCFEAADRLTAAFAADEAAVPTGPG